MDEADIVVVGGGSGGSAVAGRLSEDGRRTVALLEAGGRNTGLKVVMPGLLALQNPVSNWMYETVPQSGLGGRRGYQPRGRGLGGSSAINAMVYIRGHPWDYDHWAALGCPGWRWDDVLPWFKRAEANVRGADQWHGADGPLVVSELKHPHAGARDFIAAAESLQIPHNPDFNGARLEGVGFYQVTQKDGERWSAARAYLDHAKGRANRHVLTDAGADHVLLEEGRARGVAYTRGGQQRVIRARQGVVLAVGAFGTPQLLMLSGIGPGRHLSEWGLPVRIDRPAVGSDLQDHVDYVAAFETTGGYFLGQTLRHSLRSAGAILRWLTRRDGPMTTNYAEAGGFLRVMPGADIPDVQLHFVPAPLEDHGRGVVKSAGFSCHVCVLRPESRGTVRLAGPDSRAAPLIDPAFLADDRDLAVLKAGVRAMYRILEQQPLARHHGRDRNPPDLAPTPAGEAAFERLIRARADTVYHPVGTARMGSDAAAVCDPQLRVRGVDGLWIADASVMPRLISGNTNAPTIMIGERCADFVARDLA